jgi:hypothetical protein
MSHAVLQRKGISEYPGGMEPDTVALRARGACIYGGPGQDNGILTSADEEYDWLRRQRAWVWGTHRRGT